MHSAIKMIWVERYGRLEEKKKSTFSISSRHFVRKRKEKKSRLKVTVDFDKWLWSNEGSESSKKQREAKRSKAERQKTQKRSKKAFGDHVLTIST